MIIQLWQIRQRKKLTLKQLAEISGISKSEINDIENGKVSPRFETLEALAAALNCKIGNFVKSDYL